MGIELFLLVIFGGGAMLFVAMLPIFLIAHEISKPRESKGGGMAEE